MGFGDFMSDIGNGISNGLGKAKTFLFGGDATKGMASGPQTGDYQRQYLQGDFMNRQAPTMNVAQSADAAQARGQQGQLASMLFQQAQGQAPGAGEMAVNRQANQALANQASMAQMARGAGAGMAMRNAARTSADIGTNAAGQASIAQMQDQTNAQNQLGGLLGGMRGQDIQGRGQDIQIAGANQQSQLAQQQLQLGGLAQMLGVDQAALDQDARRRALQMGDKGMLPSLLQVGGQIGAAYAGGGAR